jgi:hypothetical protein
MNQRDKISRKSFAKWIIDTKKISGNQIFFTDEKTFCLNGPLNPQTNQIRLSIKDKKRLKAGDENLIEKVNVPQKKFPDSFMVAGGLCKNGVSKLMFCVGTIQGWAYKRAVDFFKEDSERLGGGYYFMNDGARAHLPAKTQIKELFGEDKYIENWPANSPGSYILIYSLDLNPIEDLWSIVQEKIYEKTYQNLNEMKLAVHDIWNRIPVSLCESLCSTFDKRIRQIRRTGNRFNKSKLSQKEKKKYLNWNKKWNDPDDIERVLIGKKIIQNLKDKQLKKMKKVVDKFRHKFEQKKDKLESEIEEEQNIKDVSKRKEKLDKLQRKLKELEQSYYPEQRERVKAWRDLHNMDLDTFFNNLPRDWKMNLIRERITSDNFSVTDSTEAHTLLSMSDANEDDLKLDEADLNLLNNPNEINIRNNLQGRSKGMIVEEDEEEKEIE